MSDDLLARLRAGDRRALARALTLIENRTAEGEALEAALWHTCGHAYLVGITGPPGAGKSTLIAALAEFLRSQGATVAVLAVDPTSPRSGGALLGDRIRMLEQSIDEGLFIRSVASRGRARGLAPALMGMALLLDAFGFDVIFIETVGAGQDDSAIAEMVDITLLVLVPGLGDSVQLLKAGILEIAQGYVVNKADTPGAPALARELRAAQRLATPHAPERPVFLTTATTGEGIAELGRFLLDNRQALLATDLKQRRQQRLLAEAQYRATEAFAQALQQALTELPSEFLARSPREIAAFLTQRAATFLQGADAPEPDTTSS